MENIDSDLLLNYYSKDGFMFSCPSRLIWNTLPSESYDGDSFDIEYSLEDLEDV